MSEQENLVEAAKLRGTSNAVIVGTRSIVVQERVRMLCRFGCDDYARRLSCPPFAPTPTEFRRALRDYSSALLVTFLCPATISPEKSRCLLSLTLGGEDGDVQAFWKDWYAWKTKAYESLLELEQLAFGLGLPFALAFGFGSCPLCKKCELELKDCRFPTRRRCSLEAVGVNVVATCKAAGISLEFPVNGSPTVVAMVLLS